MAETGKIRISFDTLMTHYPTYNKLPQPLQKFMDALNKITPGNTPCCVQVSHALNMAGQAIPPKSFRRDNSSIGSHKYILAVDELEQYLSGRYGKGEEIKTAQSRKRSLAEMKQYLNNRQGILLFRNAGAGHHTELWDKTRILQDGNAISGGGARMNEEAIFGQPRVLFWEVVQEEQGLIPVPPWLLGWWQVYDGNTYYYYFSDQHVVTYTKVKPANFMHPPVKEPLNGGDVSIVQDGMQIIIDWNPADGGATRETFSHLPSNTASMNGTSNRYAPLVATKMK